MFTAIKNRLTRPKGATGASAQTAVHETALTPQSRLLIGHTIGVYVTSESIYFAAVRHLGRRRTVTAAEAVQLPLGLSPDEHAAQVAQEAGRFFDLHGGRSTRVTVCVSGQGTAFRMFMLPALRRGDLQAAVRIEAAKQVPFPQADCYYGFAPIARVSSGGQSRVKIALHAVTRSLINQSLMPLTKASLPVQAIHAAPTVLGQLLSELPEFSVNRSYAVLRIGHHDTETSFYRGGTLEFFHHGGTGASMLGDHPEEAHIEYFAETLATEIQTSFDYYAGQHAVQNAQEVYVYGEAASLPRLLELLSERAGYRFAAFPADQIRAMALGRGVDREVVVEALPAVATALCHAEIPNLLPPERVEYWRRRRIDMIGRTAVAAAFLVLAGSWGFLNRDLQVHDGTVAALERQLAMFQSSEAFHTFNTLKTRVAASSKYLRETAKESTWLALNLKELSLLTPAEIRLTRYELNTAEPSQNLRIQGISQSEQVPPEVAVAEFVERLRTSGFFENVEVERHVKRRIDGEAQIDFQLLMRGIL